MALRLCAPCVLTFLHKVVMGVFATCLFYND
jgi:hypothetical protein